MTNVAFRAFACYDFGDGERFLMADVAVACGSEAHAAIESIAWAAIILYPLGIWVFTLALLCVARQDILAQKRTALMRALNFIHGDYEPLFFWWPLDEPST